MHSLPRVASSTNIDIAHYLPDLPTEDWLTIKEFVVLAAGDAIPHLTYPAASVVNAIAHHVDWCVNVAGYSMRRETIFRRDVIGAAASVMPTTHSSSRGRRRSLLLRVGEALDVIPKAKPLSPLAAASPSAPYTPDEVRGIARWALSQHDNRVSSARALVALGLGAGMPSREICSTRASDVVYRGRAVRVGDRLTPVVDEWQVELAELADAAPHTDTALFRPGVAWHKNMVTNFVTTSAPDGLAPTVQRMRSTWLVEHLATGTPMQDLLAAAGLRSMDALVRYEQFLPPASPVAPSGTS